MGQNAFRSLRDYLKHRTETGHDLPIRFSRGLLIGGSIAVSIAVLVASFVWTAMLANQFLDERKHLFLVQRDLIKGNVDRYEARLKQTAEAYELLWKLYAKDEVPAKRYRQLLDEHKGIIVTDTDITVTPMTLFSTSVQAKDEVPLSDFLRLMREISPLPLLCECNVGYFLGGFVYSSDRRLLATWPPLSDQQLDNARIETAGSFIDSYADKVDAVLDSTAAIALRGRRGAWVTAYNSPVTGELITHYAVPLYRNKQRVAVLVITIPFSKFSLLFEDTQYSEYFRVERSEPGFFIISQDRRHLYGFDDSEYHLAQSVLNSTEPLEHSHGSMKVIYNDGVFFLSQLIKGPSWIAVYAFDWKVMLAALKKQLILIAFLTSSVLAILWIFTVLLDRFVLAPLRVRSKMVYESEAFNRAVLQTAPVGLTVYDPLTDTIVMQNEVIRDMLSTSQDTGSGLYRRLLKASFWIRQPDEPDILEGKSDVRSVEISIVGAAGEQREISVAFSPVRYQQREAVLFGVTDISDQKAAVRLLRKEREMADQANQAKSHFLAMMSHEIRTPLHGALGNLELLAMEQLAPQQKERVSTIRQAFDALLVLINDILDLSKMEAHELQLHTESFRLDDLIERSARTFAPLILDKKLRFLCLIDPDLTGTWAGDGHRLGQVLMNLLSNARKFTDSGSITLRATRSESIDGIQWVRISVSDTGIGISQARLEEVFEPFVQADRSIAARFGGTGLGLTLCSRIVTLMGGRIDVDSEEGVGSLFTVSLPLQEESFPNQLLVAETVFRFNTVVLICESLLWQRALTAQIYHWLPDVTIIEADSAAAFSAENESSIIIFASSTTWLPKNWCDVQHSYLDTIIFSSCGPLYPERRHNHLNVTAYSMSMFRLALTACGNNDDVLEQRANSPIQLVTPKDCRLLIVEDDPLNRALIEHQLAALGFDKVDSAVDGSDALELCQDRIYDLIVTDLGMPVMDGQAFLKALRDRGIQTPVILSTAETGGTIQIRSSGFTSVLYKPITLDRLSAAIEKALGTLDAPSNESSATLTDLHELFISGWENDKATLIESLEANDQKRFIGSLHRLKGALLVLNEKSLADTCETLRHRVNSQGLALAGGDIYTMIKRLQHRVDYYRGRSAFRQEPID